MTQDELVALLKEEVKGLSSYLVDDDYENASDDASRETGWSFPVSTSFKTYWIKDRSKRHLFFYLMSEAAHKFKAKKFSLDQRFHHYKELIRIMDSNFEEIQKSRPEEFASVDPYYTFGTKIDAGFSYEHQTGRETTYDVDQEVIFKP